MDANHLEKGPSRVAQVGIVFGLLLLIYGFIMALMLLPGGEIILVVLALVGAAVWGRRRYPAVAATVMNSFRTQRRLALALLVVLLLLVPLVLASSPYWLFILITAMLYMMAAFGLNLQLGSTGMMNLAAAAFMAFGAYTAGLLSLNFGWPPLLTLLAGPLVTGLFSILLFVPVLKTKGHYLALVTIAFQFMVVILLDNMQWTGGPQGLKNIPLFSLFGYQFNQPVDLGFIQLHFYTNFYYLALALVVLLGWAVYRLYHSGVGITLATIRDDEVAAQTSGIQINKWKLLIFVLGNMFIGLSGAFYAHMVGFISPPNFTFEKSLVLVSIVILGGMDNLYGITAGALLLVALPEKLRVVQDYRFLIYGLVLVVMLIFKPKGLIPFTPRSYKEILKRPEKQPSIPVETGPVERPL